MPELNRHQEIMKIEQIATVLSQQFYTLILDEAEKPENQINNRVFWSGVTSAILTVNQAVAKILTTLDCQGLEYVAPEAIEEAREVVRLEEEYGEGNPSV